ncbi:MAG: glycosyltransferase, partial [Egibacteraceae bacterium]
MKALAVTHVFPRWDSDPSAPFLLTWAQALASAGEAVRVLAPWDPGLPTRGTVSGVPVRFVRYGPVRLAYQGEMHLLARRPAGPPAVAALLMCLARAVREEVRRDRPDVLHAHWWLPGALAVRLACVDVPVVVTVHGTDVALLDHQPHLATLARWALAGADRVEAVSTDLAERLERATGHAADAVNPMPVPGDRLSPLPFTAGNGAPWRILAVGRLVPEKGFADLVEAARLLGPGVVVEIVGDGPERQRLAALAARLGVRLDLPGRRTPDELRDAYARAGVVAQPSHREGLGLVAAEALCMGLAVVATDSGGARDLLDDLVPPGDVQ